MQLFFYQKKFLEYSGNLKNAIFTPDRELVHRLLKSGKLPNGIPEMLRICKVLGLRYRGK